MIEFKKVAEVPGLIFAVMVAGAEDAPLVLLLHGFAESFHMWRAQMPALAAAGYRAVAPSQRGYSAGARPDPREPANYSFDHLLSDALSIAAGCGNAEPRFHLVGHDWGGSIAGSIADRYPARLASLTVLSRPHPNAFNRAPPWRNSEIGSIASPAQQRAMGADLLQQPGADELVHCLAKRFASNVCRQVHSAISTARSRGQNDALRIGEA
jgi:pimeloyl-ACP methyl ester carboxylesterase